MNHNITFSVKHQYKQLMYSLWTPDMHKNCTIQSSGEIIQISRQINFIHKTPVIQRLVLASEYRIIGDELTVYDTNNNTCKIISNIQVIDEKTNEHIMDVSERKIYKEIINNNLGTEIIINSLFEPKKSIPDIFTKYWVDGYKDYYKNIKIVNNNDNLYPMLYEKI